MIRIYVITNTVNGKMYVGQTRRKGLARWREHLKCANNGEKQPLYSSMRKYGRDSFVYDEVVEFDTQEEANKAEHLWVVLMDAHTSTNGYVCTWKGDGRAGPGNEYLRTRALKGTGHMNFRHDIDSNEMIRLYDSGLSMAKVGRLLGCGAQLVKMRLRKFNIKARGNHSYSGYKNKGHTPETCRRMSLSRKGSGTWNYRSDLDENINEMAALYISGRTGAEIANQFGADSSVVISRLRLYGVQIRPSRSMKRT